MRLRIYRCALNGLIRVLTACLLLSGGAAYANANNSLRDYRSADIIDPIEVQIRAFNVVGDNPLSAKVTQSILDPFLGDNKGIADIEGAVKQLEKKLKKEGHSFYRVEVTSQELVGGEVELTVRRYRIGEIRVTGNRFYSDENILASVPQLVKGASPSTASMSRSLSVANQNSGKRTLLQLAASGRPNELDAAIQVIDQKPRIISAWTNNTGTRETGRYRVGIGLEHRNLFEKDHVVNVSFITSPEDFDAVQQAAITYQIPLYRLGGKLNFIAVNSDIDTGTVADVFDVAGRGEVYGLGYTQVLPSVGKIRHHATLDITDKYFENDILFSGEQIGPDVRSRPLSLRYQAEWKSDELVLGLSLAYAKNLSGGRVNDAASYQASRNDANHRWDTVSAGVSMQYHIGDWQLTGNFDVRDTSDRLITGEQFALGGASSIRGMEERELNGDIGYRAGLQLWVPALKSGLRPVLFLEGGQVEINRPEIDEIVDESVTSIGAALFWNPNPRINLSMSLGHLIDGIDSANNDGNASQDGDNKLHFNVAYRF